MRFDGLEMPTALAVEVVKLTPTTATYSLNTVKNGGRDRARTERPNDTA